ncbi:hypothetical protein N7486_003972 [Neofusicoccum parvum]|uniref:Uncharacterized protein n=1 Tax=Neofusicoccum parvum TaxID=310453 RepID=A0ACB5S459_9PEZI|nr:hypothetical protein N7486_003972 [Neofusicoccum parvum]
MTILDNLNIDHRVSTAVAPEDIGKFGGFTSLPVRIGKHDEIANAACAQVLKDWAAIIGDGRDQNCEGAGLVNRTGNGCTVAFCETLPERIEVLTYWTGLMALWDDSAESTNAIEAREKWDLPIHKFFAAVMEDPDFKPKTPIQAIMLPWVQRLLSTDPKLGLVVLDVQRQYYEQVDTKEVDEFKTVEEYLPYRKADCDALLWLTLLRYGLDLNLTDAELADSDHIASTGMGHMALVNDYWSWPKEKATAQQGGRAMNAVNVIMREHGLSEPTAHEHLKTLIADMEQRLVSEVNRWLAAGERSEEARRYVDAIVLCAGGNMYWASSCPRYNAHRAAEIALALGA